MAKKLFRVYEDSSEQAEYEFHEPEAYDQLLAQLQRCKQQGLRIHITLARARQPKVSPWFRLLAWLGNHAGVVGAYRNARD